MTTKARKVVKPRHSTIVNREVADLTTAQVEIIRRRWFNTRLTVGDIADELELEPDTIWIVGTDPSIKGEG